MNSRMRKLIILQYAVTLTVNIIAYQHNEFDLPGILSSDACSQETLKDLLSPLCSCKDQHGFTDLHSLCRVHIKLGECIDENIKKANNETSYMFQVFGKGRLRQNLDHLCHRKDDANEITMCSSPDVITSCNHAFQSGLGNLTHEHACRLTEDLGECIWNKTKTNNCSATTMYYWWKLADAHVARSCTKYGKAKSDKCEEVQQAFHPLGQAHSREECRKMSITIKQCFILERLDSIHHKDIWQNMEFDIERSVDYLNLACDFLRQKDVKCETRNRLQIINCVDKYGNETRQQMEMLEQGLNVTVQDVCQVYDKSTKCFYDGLKSCANSTIYYHALVCSGMPATCYCPVNIKLVRTGQSSGTISRALHSYVFIVFLSIAYHTLIW